MTPRCLVVVLVGDGAKEGPLAGVGGPTSRRYERDSDWLASKERAASAWVILKERSVWEVWKEGSAAWSGWNGGLLDESADDAKEDSSAEGSSGGAGRADFDTDCGAPDDEGTG